MPSLSGLPVLLALWSAVPSFELHFAWPFGGAVAASAPLSGWPVLFVRFFLCLGLVEVLGVCWAFCFLGVFAWAAAAAAAAAAALRLCAVYLGAVHIIFFLHPGCHFLDLSLLGLVCCWRCWCQSTHCPGCLACLVLAASQCLVEAGCGP